MNKELLLYEMKRQKVSAAKMCSVLGICRSSFYRKCNGISEFTRAEIQKVVCFLKLDSPMEIFFAH